MSVNRLLLHVSPSCPCCRARRLIERLTAETGAIEAACGNAVEFWIPNADRVVDEGLDRIEIISTVRAEPAPINGDIAAHVASELRRMADRLVDAADSIDRMAGTSPAGC